MSNRIGTLLASSLLCRAISYRVLPRHLSGCYELATGSASLHSSTRLAVAIYKQSSVCCSMVRTLTWEDKCTGQSIGSEQQTSNWLATLNTQFHQSLLGLMQDRAGQNTIWTVCMWYFPTMCWRSPSSSYKVSETQCLFIVCVLPATSISCYCDYHGRHSKQPTQRSELATRLKRACNVSLVGTIQITLGLGRILYVLT